MVEHVPMSREYSLSFPYSIYSRITICLHIKTIRNRYPPASYVIAYKTINYTIYIYVIIMFIYIYDMYILYIYIYINHNITEY